MARYRAYLPKGAIIRGASMAIVVWSKVVVAKSYREAVEKITPAFVAEALPLVRDETIKYVSLYVGEKDGTNKACRMTPIQFTRDGQRRHQ